MHHRAVDLTGHRFGWLVAVEYAGSNGFKSLWRVRCDCGVEKVLIASELRKGNTNSCGCQKNIWVGDAQRTHGMSEHPAYWVWRSMVDRCKLPTHQAWANYGGRGIRVCKRWEKFENFWTDMGPTYVSGLTLERNDNEAGYSKNNCRWATYQEQSNNKRTTRRIETPWGDLTVTEAARKSGIGITTLLYRLGVGCPLDMLFTKPDVSNRLAEVNA